MRFSLMLRTNLLVFAATFIMTLSGWEIRGEAAVVARINSDGTLLSLTPVEGEQLVTGDLYFVIFGGTMRGVGEVKSESAGETILKLSAPITNLGVGDDVFLSHDISWVQVVAKSSVVVPGTVAKVAQRQVYIAIDDGKLPLFSIGQQMDLQLDETLEIVPATVREYRPHGIWFKVKEGVEKLTPNRKVSFLFKEPADDAAKARNGVKRERAQKGSLPASILGSFGRIAQRFKVESLNETTDLGGMSIGIMSGHDFSLKNKQWCVPFNVGLSYDKVSWEKDRDKQVITQFSAELITGISFIPAERIRGSINIGYDYGLSGQAISTVGANESTMGVHQDTLLYGISGSYRFSESFGVGLEAVFSSGTVSFTDAKSMQFTGNRQRAFISFIL